MPRRARFSIVGTALAVPKPRARDFVSWFAELWAAWGIAVVQPLLALLGDSTDFFLSYGFSPVDVRVFVAMIALTAPTVMWILELLTHRWPLVRARIHYSFVAVCGLAAVAQVCKTVLNLDGLDYVVATSLAAMLLLAGYLSWKSLREWLSFAALVPVLAVGLFVTTTPSGRYARASVQQTTVDTPDSVIDVPIVMLMLDEFPLASLLDGSGSIDKVRYPNFARLASLSTWYRNYSTTSELTGYAIPSTLSGLRPRKGTSPTYIDHPRTLISLVRDSHDVHVTETLTDLCAPEVCTSPGNNDADTESARRDWEGLVRGVTSVMRQRLDTTKKNEVDVFAARDAADAGNAEENATGQPPTGAKPSKLSLVATSQAARLARWIDGLRSTGPSSTSSRKPPFHFLHVLFPHQKWMFLPDGSTYSSPGPEWTDDETPWQVRVREQRHLLQVQYLDSLIGRMLDALESSGLLDESLIVVAADHGISFMHGYHRRYAGGDLSNATHIMHVPLFVHYPNQRAGEFDDSNVENIDLLPMLAEKVGFTIPWKVDGLAPSKKVGGRAETKTLNFIGRPLGGPPRSGTSMTVSMTQFTRETLSWGFRGEQSGGNRTWVQYLYDASPYKELIGSDVSRFTSTSGTLSFSFSDARARTERPFHVNGTIRGQVSSEDWFAFAIDGQLLGLSPSAAAGAATPVTALLPTTAATAAGLAVYRIVDDSTLERVSVVR